SRPGPSWTTSLAKCRCPWCKWRKDKSPIIHMQPQDRDSRGLHEISMTTVNIQNVAGSQSVILPSEFRFSVEVVTIRKEGEAVILEPLKSVRWPDRFFEEIRIDDPAF